MIDERVINSGLITHQAQVELVIGGHRKILLANITNIGRYACILAHMSLSNNLLVLEKGVI